MRVRHTTEYIFSKVVGIAPHELRLRPAAHCRTPISAYELRATPDHHYVHWMQDAFGNYLARFTFTAASDLLKFDVELVADIKEINPFDFFVENSAAEFPFRYNKQLQRDLAYCLDVVEPGDEIDAWVNAHGKGQKPTIEFLVDLNRAMRADIDYVIRLEPGIQNCAQTLKHRSGSCRDSAWLLIQVLRRLGLAARFVSGYLVELASDSATDTTESAANLHAWAEVYLPGAGWVGLDPTSGMLAGSHHIPLAVAPWPDSAAPVMGATEPCDVKFRYSSSAVSIS